MSDNITSTTDQVAAALGVHPNTIRQHARAGTIPCRKVGRNYKYNIGLVRTALILEGRKVLSVLDEV
jgi:excisionase family DNA binding protein